jgi:hypothetical protein
VLTGKQLCGHTPVEFRTENLLSRLSSTCALDPHHARYVISLLSFQADYLALGFHQQHECHSAAAVPLNPDSGVLGSDATSSTLHNITDTSNDDIVCVAFIILIL